MKDRTRFERTLAISATLAVAGLALFALLTLLGGGSGAVHAAPNTELQVCPSGCAYAYIQEAVDAADPGDVIKVAQGTYTDVHHIASLDTSTFTATQIVAITKSVTLRGGYNADFSAWDPQAYRTLLDAGGRGRGILIAGAGITPTVEGLHVTGGDATGLGGEWWQDSGLGGGVYVQAARPVISGNVVYANTAPDYGGGILIRKSDATIAGNHIYGNTSNARGGGLYLDDGSDVTLRDNAIYSNTTALQGGGIGLYWSNPTIEGNLIYSNTSAYAGGGVYLYGAGASLSANVITGNVALQGGGLWAKDCPTIDLVNNVLAQNRADVAGSGLYVDNDPWYDTAGRLRHNTIVSNTGVGQGVFVGVNTTLSFTNTIIVSHTVGVTVTGGSTVTLDTTLWHANGSDWGGNVSSANDYHQALGLAADGYHLITGSFAIDRGVDAGVTTDVDGDARPQGAGFDIGADEFPAGKPDIVWDKQVRVNDGAFQAYGDGPFSVLPGDVVTVVDRVWVTVTWNISFTLDEAWSPSLVWGGYQATTGAVSPAADSATWSATGAAPNTWHVLTKTWQVTTSVEYVGTLTETLRVAGLTVQLPERVLRFQHARPQPTWEKMVRINAGAFQSWDAGPFTVTPGDEMMVVDRIRITHTTGVSFTLAEGWGAGLDLNGWSNSAGAVITGAGTLTWRGTNVAPAQWHVLTTTLRVGSGTWLQETLTETLTIAGLDPQLPRRTLTVVNLGASTGCYARINDGVTTYPTVQAAVDAAQPGDLVKVAGTCSAVNSYGDLAQVVYLDKGLTIRGGYTTTNWTTPDPAAHPSTLDAQGAGRVLYITGDISPTIQGLRITGGDAQGLGGHIGGDDSGGGIYLHAVRPVITGNVVFSNTADLGGGLYLNTSAATITGNDVASNTVADAGGGLYLYWSNGATLHKNTIAANLADFGGGVFLRQSAATLRENTISNNLARKDSGGVSVGSSSATLRANVISGNQANHTAGGLSLYSCYGALLEGNEIAANTAGHNAGGMWLDASDVTLVNNAVVKNQAGAAGSGVYVQAATVRMVHTTVAQNSGGDGSGLHVVAAHPNYSTVALTNTIVAGHRVGVTVTAGNEATLNATLWHGNTITDSGGAGSVNRLNDHHGDPVFAADGYHLGSTSAAIDRGLNAGVATDVDGQTRPRDSGYDIGADEFVCVGLTGVSIAGLTTGTVGVVYAFTATVAPPSASPPITYTWDPAPALGSLLLPGGSATAYAWDAAGDYTITLTATNCGGSDTATHTIHVESREQYIYLPLVLRNR